MIIRSKMFEIISDGCAAKWNVAKLIIIFSYLCAIFRSKGGETSEKTGCATYRITDEFVLHSYDRYGSSCCLRVHNALLL